MIKETKSIIVASICVLIAYQLALELESKENISTIE